MNKFLACLSTLIISSTFASTQNIRQRCENYHLSTGNVKYHQYSVVVDWSKINDSSHEKLDDLLFGKFFEVVLEQDLKEFQTLYHIKEVGTFYARDYENEINSLSKITQVNCLFDLIKKRK